MQSNVPKKEIAIDILLMLATIGATFIFGIFALPHVQMNQYTSFMF